MYKINYLIGKSLLNISFNGHTRFYTIIGSTNGMMDAHSLRGRNLPTWRHSHPFITIVIFAGKKWQESFTSVAALFIVAVGTLLPLIKRKYTYKSTKL